MSNSTKDNQSDLACPECHTVGSVFVNKNTSLYHCRICHAKGFNPYPEVKTRKKHIGPKTDPRPKIPEAALDTEIVVDRYQEGFFTFGEDGFTFTPVSGSKPFEVSRAYCPRRRINEQQVFDPTTKEAQFYLHLHAKRFKNRRRYQRDLERKIKEGDK